MIIDGERLKELLRTAEKEAIICAPFIKVAPLKILLDQIDADVKITVCTRWRADEVAAGVSDLGVFDVLNERENATLTLLDELHAKLFAADQQCLAGSANVTGAALGWSAHPNVELMVAAERRDLDVQQLLSRLERATPATFQMKEAIEKEAAKIQRPNLPESEELEGEQSSWATPWLPQCAAPDKLFRVYQDPATDAVTPGTREDALSDLNALVPPQGLSKDEFNEYIEATLRRLPSVKTITQKIPERVNDQQGAELVGEINPGMSDAAKRKQWAILRDWFREFFANSVEVAPESYVVRLKPSQK